MRHRGNLLKRELRAAKLPTPLSGGTTLPTPVAADPPAPVLLTATTPTSRLSLAPLHSHRWEELTSELRAEARPAGAALECRAGWSGWLVLTTPLPPTAEVPVALLERATTEIYGGSCKMIHSLVKKVK